MPQAPSLLSLCSCTAATIHPYTFLHYLLDTWIVLGPYFLGRFSKPRESTVEHKGCRLAEFQLLYKHLIMKAITWVLPKKMAIFLSHLGTGCTKPPQQHELEECLLLVGSSHLALPMLLPLWEDLVTAALLGLLHITKSILVVYLSPSLRCVLNVVSTDHYII